MFLEKEAKWKRRESFLRFLLSCRKYDAMPMMGNADDSNNDDGSIDESIGGVGGVGDRNTQSFVCSSTPISSRHIPRIFLIHDVCYSISSFL